MDIIINIFKTMIEFAFQITGDWGIAIVLLTITVKLLMLPFSIKQRIAMKKQIVFSKEIEAVKKKYKNNKKRQDDELNKLYLNNSKGMFGCFLSLLQLPIISGLYMSISRLPVEAMIMLIPWAMNIGSTDDKFIVPLIYTIVSILPSIKSIIPMLIFGLVITVKAPIGLGIYFITSSIFTLLEDIGFKIYSKNKVFA
ncbi:YidC/Oxa1 family membrane protein insertase [Clostridium tertium]|uniref:YidC/Oxa1 family membrane protein insertase n=1 Tax=Clostridium tertium TaxID=1559 RepID=A0A9X3XIU6_9CLOT|nr:YidC/Oxa1 family membrane protein insertase [Clostridium tertium]MDC4238844.1 YidC/Oxa1 family membrane protein insertase [Clostridium tertium]